MTILVSIIAFQALQKASKIAWTHNTLHLILMVLSITLVLFACAILINAKQLIPVYNQLPKVLEIMPNYFPKFLNYFGYFFMCIAAVLSVSAIYESRIGLIIFSIFSTILMIFLLLLVLDINYSSLVLSEELDC